ncbi:ABC-type multidrug transport system, ATPase component [Frankia canadensis]|uniref:ABC-type multidrug transport system, ATPase component n=1 Tax=Frankia canadensis TaxID=1836972 RepID=A0A2I2KX16_9ACTN|nr:ABC transporter ATP-binding protein [Frankia canadensis]SNQ50198.1 ABC-type multidrug transport system, ATPase component [Frankia canadensis]SOU57488.1 ABC-type multidrug transport system, ATPase component [Frankia canadensis]
MTTTTHPPGRGAIDVRGLTKRYGRRTVVSGLDVTIPEGVVAGFVGPNGAGKTTTLRMLLGLVRPTEGEGTVLGQPLRAPAAYLPRVGALIESPALYPTLSGTRNLAALAALAGLGRAEAPARVAAILDQVGLAGRGGDQVRSYSLGMKQRLAIGAALLTDPDLLILDEPTNGLDPIGIREMRTLIRSLTARDGRTVLVSSHLLAEVEQMCDWLIVVEGGRLAYQGPTDRLMASTSTEVVLRPEHEEDVAPLADLLAGLSVPATRGPAEVVATLTTPGSDGAREYARALAAVNRAAASRGITLIEMSPRRHSLEDRYQGLVTQSRAPEMELTR